MWAKSAGGARLPAVAIALARRAAVLLAPVLPARVLLAPLLLTAALAVALSACADSIPPGSSPRSAVELTIGEPRSGQIAALGIYYLRFTATTTSHTVTLFDLQSDMTWRLYLEADFDSGSLAATCGEPDNGPVTESCTLDAAFLGFDLTPGQAYYLRVDEWDNVAGTFRIVVN